jgi:hypothetical protein
VHARRNAAALGEEAVHPRLDVGLRGGVIARQRGDIVGRERRQRQRLALAAALDRCRDGRLSAPLGFAAMRACGSAMVASPNCCK